ncbi:MAG: leucyl aminopeptidase [Sphingomonas bacterium]|nr:leucyl aminopeptidase family protein [Sphingomonas bacterium]MDB5688681.1 leucyl aminopeptidase [Sphingomonas bacterium]
MIDCSTLYVADRGQDAHDLHIIDKAGFDAWLHGLPAPARAAAGPQRFRGAASDFAILPGEGDRWTVAVGVADASALTPWCLAAAAERLPEGVYRMAGVGDPGPSALGWMLAQYRFDRYRSSPDPVRDRVLLTRQPSHAADMVRLAQATALVRDLVNTPAADMGPAELADAVEKVAKAAGAAFRVTGGDSLAQGYPMISAVGRAATPARAPRLIELEWGDPANPRIAIVGKGVCFDSGGLDIKPASGMLLMKKDMGGAAHALALAQLVMQARLPVRLHLLIPAVENAISADAFRPGDVLTSRAGLHVEIGNTDAEGRLVLADALTRAGEDKPALIVDFATLTGAARVALGPDLPALFANDDSLAAVFGAAAEGVADPLWRMPLWSGYADMLKSGIADINNAGESGFAGAVTAALFLQRFVPAGTPWAHLDTFAWRPAAKPGRPKGGEALGLRAAWEMLLRRFP